MYTKIRSRFALLLFTLLVSSSVFAADPNRNENTTNVTVAASASDATTNIQRPPTITTPTNVPLLSAGVLTSSYGSRVHPVSGKRKQHKGIDVSLPMGTPIYAPADGNVIFSGWKRGYGYVVQIDHNNGYVTLFAHNKVNLVKLGDIVTSASIIARVGATGVATGPHIHFEISFHGKQVNPINFYQKPPSL